MISSEQKQAICKDDKAKKTLINPSTQNKENKHNTKKKPSIQ